MILYPLPHPDVEILGASGFFRSGYGLRPRRLPQPAFKQVPTRSMGLMVEAASGVRLRFSTEAVELELDAFVFAIQLESLMEQPFTATVDLVVDGRLVKTSVVDSGVGFMPSTADDPRLRPTDRVSTIHFGPLPTGRKLIEVWLPHNAVVDLCELRADAPVRPAGPTGQPIWIHHGSSISHSLEATHPTGTWPAVAALQADLELWDMSFAGNALLDPFVARTIRDCPADLITLKLGINLVNANSMSMRSFVPAVHGFLDTIRDGHPETPMVVISPIICPAVETTAGPTAINRDTGRVVSLSDTPQPGEGELTLTRIRESLASIVEQGDEADALLSYLDGRELLGDDDVGHLHDGLHPDPAGYQLIGDRFAQFLRTADLA